MGEKGEGSGVVGGGKWGSRGREVGEKGEGSGGKGEGTGNGVPPCPPPPLYKPHLKTKSYITTRRKVHVINGSKRTWWVTQVSLATSTRKHRKKARCIEQVLSFHLNAL